LSAATRIRLEEAESGLRDLGATADGRQPRLGNVFSLCESVAGLELDGIAVSELSVLLASVSSHHGDLGIEAAVRHQRLLCALCASQSVRQVTDFDLPAMHRQLASLGGPRDGHEAFSDDQWNRLRSEIGALVGNGAPPVAVVGRAHRILARSGLSTAHRLAGVVTPVSLATLAGLPSPALDVNPGLLARGGDYRRALDDDDAWLDFFAGVVIERAGVAGERINSATRLREAEAGGSSGGNIGRVVDLSLEQPLLTARYTADRLDMSHQGVLNLIRKLERSGWLTLYGTFGRGGRKHWVAPEAFRLFGIAVEDGSASR
jgi:hypothetical protein